MNKNMSADQERSGNWIELYIRKLVTSLFYFRGYRVLFPSNPFYTPGAVRYISKYLNPEMKLFEWGAGISSVWYARRIGEYIAVEHNEQWFNRVQISLRNKGLSSAKLLFAPEKQTGRKYGWQNEWRYYDQINECPQNTELKDYIFSIDAYPDAYFDVIVIDGRERIPCLLHARDKLNQHGILIFDDSARPRYNKCFTILKDWEFIQFDFGLKQTTIFARNRDDL